MGLTPTKQAIIGQYINGRNATDDFLQLATNYGGTVFGWIDSDGILRGTLAGGGGGGTPGGPTGSIQFNNTGVFGGDSSFVWDNTNKSLVVGHPASSFTTISQAELALGWGDTGTANVQNNGSNLAYGSGLSVFLQKTSNSTLPSTVLSSQFNIENSVTINTVELIGINSQVYLNGTGDVNRLDAVVAEITSDAANGPHVAGNIVEGKVFLGLANMYMGPGKTAGHISVFEGGVGNFNTGTITNAYSFFGQCVNQASGTIVNSYEFYGQAPGAGGSIKATNNYGLYVEDFGAGANDYAIYSAGGKNTFRGDMWAGPPIGVFDATMQVVLTNDPGALHNFTALNLPLPVYANTQIVTQQSSASLVNSLAVSSFHYINVTGSTNLTNSQISAAQFAIGYESTGNTTSNVELWASAHAFQHGSSATIGRATAVYGYVTSGDSGGTITQADVFLSGVSTGATTHVESGRCYYAAGTLPNFGGTITNLYGFYADGQIGATNSYSFYSADQGTTAGHWGFFSDGNTPSKFTGNILVGATAPATGTAATTLSSTVSTMAAPTVTPTGGAATSWTYRIQAVCNNVVIAVSPAGTTAVGAATLDGTHYNTVTWTAVPGATEYVVYVGTGTGAGQNEFGNIARVSAPTVTFKDTGATEPFPGTADQTLGDRNSICIGQAGFVGVTTGLAVGNSIFDIFAHSEDNLFTPDSVLAANTLGHAQAGSFINYVDPASFVVDPGMFAGTYSAIITKSVPADVNAIITGSYATAAGFHTSGNISKILGFASLVNNQFAGTVTEVTGVYTGVTSDGPSAGLTTTRNGLHIWTFGAGSPVNATNVNGILIGDQGPGSTSSTNVAALHIEAQTHISKAIWVEGGAVVLESASVLTFNGSTGTASIGVASAAGTPNKILLPTTTGTAGQVLKTDGGNPQQLSWITPSGTGTVTSVGYTGDGVIFNATVSGSPVTTSGTFVPALLTQTANTFLGGPSSAGPSAPTFRALQAVDIPSLDASKIATGTFALARGGTNTDLSATGGANQVLMQTSVGGNITVAQLGFSNLSGSIALGQTPLTTLGDMLYVNVTPALTRLAGNTTSTKMYLSQTGTGAVSAAPAWAQIAAADLSNGTTGSGAVVLANAPALTGNATAVTQIASDNTTKIATTAFVQSVALTAGAVTSVFGRAGVVVATSGDYSFSLISGTASVAQGGTGANLSATGGASQVLKQTSVGGNVTVAQLAASDLSNGTTGSGSVVLATSPTLAGTPLSTTPATADSSTKIATTAYVQAQKYAATFTNQTTLSVSGATHGLGTADLIIFVYDSATGTRNQIQPNSVSVDTSTFNVTVTFTVSQSGRIIIHA